MYSHQYTAINVQYMYTLPVKHNTFNLFCIGVTCIVHNNNYNNVVNDIN